jgi:large-conductance mechanosensitive channel
MRKGFLAIILIVAFVLSAFSIWSMTSKLNNEKSSSLRSKAQINHNVTKERLLHNKNDLICSAQGDIRPPPWDDEEEYVPSGS